MDNAETDHKDAAWVADSVLNGAETEVNIPEDLKVYLFASVIEKAEQCIIVTLSERTGEKLAADLRDFTQKSVEVLPVLETLPFEKIAPNKDTIARRFELLHNLPDVLIVPFQAFYQEFSKRTFDKKALHIIKGNDYSFAQLVRELESYGLERVDLVSKKGEYAVRGSIIDVFPANTDHPLRLDFFGDTLDEIKAFSTLTQLSIESQKGKNPSEVYVYPMREIVLDAETAEIAESLFDCLPEQREMLENVIDEIYAPGMEFMFDLLARDKESVLQILPTDALFIVDGLENIKNRASAYEKMVQDINVQEVFGKTSVDVRDLIDDAQNMHIDFDAVKYKFQMLLELLDFPTDDSFALKFADFDVTTQKLIAEQRVSAAKTVHKRKSHIEKSKDPVDLLSLQEGDYIVHVTQGIGRFVALETKKIQVSAFPNVADFFDSQSAKRENSAASKYKKVEREFVVLEYAPQKRGFANDRLLIPTNQLDLISRYVGSDSPKLSRLGGDEWAREKSKARRRIRQIAADLVRLYSVRESVKGYAFSPDTPWQRELEDTFEYIETPDQLQAINDVKHDMEQAKPMDRLISGDVGYGKTEIAIRAAMKAAQDNKQTAILAPTTLLASQHFETFSARFKPFPITIRMLSRFQTDKQVADTIKDIESGAVDIVIGTHKLLSDKVKFKDLGLIVIDEEQRFGVAHKEKLKQLRLDADVLTMSATPIPRTLEMSLSGIREMSTLATPPQDRLPILTFVGRHEKSIVESAIRRELLRDGQVFYVHNKISDIERTHSMLQKLVPTARIAVAHGSLSESTLEQRVQDFYHHETDILLSTTIIETGIDIPDANTLIVDNAERFGLAGLHQLRGRVGRGTERAYAYFFYAPNRILTEPQYKRLKVIAENNELGSGAIIAMQDLELRGAGNLLGAEQAGHIEGVGFDMYIKMIGDAVYEYKNGKKAKADRLKAAPSIDIPKDALIPVSYISSENLRLEAYKKIASTATQGELEAVRAELTDRYGPIPAELESLLTVQKVRVK
ncbi:MAG: transcription-repair coupling factor [Bifidobacteriaceae bacterium]|jgi:transcription-repair coupling factor (superfamily II helicase)|nr:transcription-repair coupling factor [Bifidobacteriaceae bacterium]